MTPTHLPTELVPCTCNHQGVQAVPVTAALGRLGAPASMDWHFSDQAECARAAPPRRHLQGSATRRTHSPGPGPAHTAARVSCPVSAACVCPVTVGLPRLDGRAGLQAPILAGCHPSLVALQSKGPGGGVPELHEDAWHNRRESSRSPGPGAPTAPLP